MANLQKYPVHSDYAKLPSMPFPFNGVVTTVLNQCVLLDVWLRQWNTLSRATRHWVASTDRSYFRVYEIRPERSNPDEILPAVVYYHGGAFVLTYSSSHVAHLQTYANNAHCAVFLVDYRLAPWQVFPNGFEDCWSALLWVKEKADWLHVDANRVVLMGDSAGGCLAAGVAQKAHDVGVNLRGQCLIYPALDNSCSSVSASTFNDAPVFNGVANQRMWKVYLPGSGHGVAPPYAVPAARESVSGLCQAYVETAEYDPLRDERKEYASRLHAAGVHVVENHTSGTVHGFDMVVRNAISIDAVRQRSHFLTTVFS